MELLERMFAASSASAQFEDDRAAAAIWKLEIFWWQAQLEGTGLQLQSGNSRFFGGRPSWKATGLQLQSGNSRFLVVGPVGRRQGYNCNLGTRDFWGPAQLEGDTATTAIWELEIFGGRPSWKATGLQLQSGNSRFFWWQAQLKGERATTALWEPEIFGGRPSWKATGLQLQSGNSRFFGGRPS